MRGDIRAMLLHVPCNCANFWYIVFSYYCLVVLCLRVLFKQMEAVGGQREGGKKEKVYLSYISFMEVANIRLMIIKRTTTPSTSQLLN